MAVRGKTHAVVTGGAGFIGSNLVDQLMLKGYAVTVIDNLSGGKKEFIQHHVLSPGFHFITADVRQKKTMQRVLPRTADVVFHLAANADISKGIEDPSLDYENTIAATFSLLEAMRHRGIQRLLYASGSGVYGDRGTVFSSESAGPYTPVSMYGATKLGAEGLISAYAHLFGIQVWIVRPANIIGPRLTHGVVYDFLHRLKKDPSQLHILGDGKQSKSYLYVDDVLRALFLIMKKAKRPVNIFNISSQSYITVNEIADCVIHAMNLQNVKRTYSGGHIGWKGDVATVRISSARLRNLGWKPHYTSLAAVRRTLISLLSS